MVGLLLCARLCLFIAEYAAVALLSLLLLLLHCISAAACCLCCTLQNTIELSCDNKGPKGIKVSEYLGCHATKCVCVALWYHGTQTVGLVKHK